jgi:hypothetical protein
VTVRAPAIQPALTYKDYLHEGALA